MVCLNFKGHAILHFFNENYNDPFKPKKLNKSSFFALEIVHMGDFTQGGEWPNEIRVFLFYNK